MRKRHIFQCNFFFVYHTANPDKIVLPQLNFSSLLLLLFQILLKICLSFFKSNDVVNLIFFYPCMYIKIINKIFCPYH